MRNLEKLGNKRTPRFIFSNKNYISYNSRDLRNRKFYRWKNIFANIRIGKKRSNGKIGRKNRRDKEEKRYNKTVNNTRSPSEINQMVRLRYYKGDSQIGHPREGFNWYWEDSFVCPNCKMYLFVLWENLSSNDEDELVCPKCHHRFLVICSLNELLNGILIGAPYPGLNIGNRNIFRCPACLSYIKEKDVNLPMEGICDHCYSDWKFYPHRFREELVRVELD